MMTCGTSWSKISYLHLNWSAFRVFCIFLLIIWSWWLLWVCQTMSIMRGCLKDLPTYQWLTALSQLVSRICHQNEELVRLVKQIIISVLQVMWISLPFAINADKCFIECFWNSEGSITKFVTKCNSFRWLNSIGEHFKLYSLDYIAFKSNYKIYLKSLSLRT